MESLPLEDSYLLPYDLLYQPISYVTVSFTLFLFMSSSNREHHVTYDGLLYDIVAFIPTWIASSIAKYLTRPSAVTAYFQFLWKLPPRNTCQSRFWTPKSFVDPPPPPYKLHQKDPLEVEYTPIGNLVAEFTRMMFDLLSNMDRKLMAEVSFVLFAPTVEDRPLLWSEKVIIKEYSW